MLTVRKRIRILENQVKFISRSLSGKATILVQQGQQISPQDILAKTVVRSGFRLIHLSQALQVKPGDVKKYLNINLGQKIFKGELLAFKPRKIFQDQKLVTAPMDGILQAVDEVTGQARFSFLPQAIDVPSAFYGFVEKIDSLRGKVWIKTCVTEIFGICGSGKVREGILKLIGKRGDLITKEKITPGLAEHIIIGGGLIYQQAIEASIGFGVAGIITGGINAKDFQGMSGGILTTTPKFGTDIGISVVVMEGFGSVSIGEDVYNIFEKFNGKFAIVDGNRAEIQIPAEDKSCMLKIKSTNLPKRSLEIPEGLGETDIDTLEVGKRVRVVGPSFFGTIGKVAAIDKQSSKLQSGISTYLVIVETSTKKIRVPYMNLEII